MTAISNVVNISTEFLDKADRQIKGWCPIKEKKIV